MHYEHTKIGMNIRPTLIQTSQCRLIRKARIILQGE